MICKHCGNQRIGDLCQCINTDAVVEKPPLYQVAIRYWQPPEPSSTAKDTYPSYLVRVTPTAKD